MFVSEPQIVGLDAPVGVSFTGAYASAISRMDDPRLDLSSLRFLEAADPSVQALIAPASAKACVSVRLGDPSEPATLRDFGLDAELLEVSVLAALQRTKREALDIVQISGYSPNQLLTRPQVDVLRRLKDEGLVRNWGVRARTVKQAMRAMSVLGISYVSFSASDLGWDAVPGILAAAERARTSVIVSVSADTPAEVIATLRKQNSVLGVLIEVNFPANLEASAQTISYLHAMSQVKRIA